MSFSDAIGQVDQIVQWEQQLANPAAATQSSGTAATGTTSNTGSSDSSSSSSGSSFSDALAQAQSQDGTSALSVLNSADTGTDTSGSTDSSSLLSGGDSQLLSALQSAQQQLGRDRRQLATQLRLKLSALITALESALGSSGTTAPTPRPMAPAPRASSPRWSRRSRAAARRAAPPRATSAAPGTFGSAATSAGDPRIESMIQEANSLLGKPYVWGGGHSNFGPQSGYDCSGFVSAVLHAGGYLTSPQDTETLPTAPGSSRARAST